MGSVLQQAGGGRCNGRVASPRRSCRSPPHTPPGDRDMEDSRYSPGYTSQNSCVEDLTRSWVHSFKQDEIFYVANLCKIDVKQSMNPA